MNQALQEYPTYVLSADQCPPGDDRRHGCGICHRRFNRPSSVLIHMNSHTGAQRKFSQTLLTSLLRSHPCSAFECPFPGCTRRFSVSSNMRRHYRNHLTARRRDVVARMIEHPPDSRLLDRTPSQMTPLPSPIYPPHPHPAQMGIGIQALPERPHALGPTLHAPSATSSSISTSHLHGPGPAHGHALGQGLGHGHGHVHGDGHRHERHSAPRAGSTHRVHQGEVAARASMSRWVHSGK